MEERLKELISPTSCRENYVLLAFVIVIKTSQEFFFFFINFMVVEC